MRPDTKLTPEGEDPGGTEHLGLMGHGPCERCGCTRFTWKGFTPEFLKYLDETKRKEKKS